jgi:4-aminobutyrate aminotransferase
VDGDGTPDATRTAAVLQHLLREERVVVMSCGPYGSTVRWIPPLVISDEQVDGALAAFDRALAATG